MFCMNCGKFNPDSASKCKYCGGTLSNHPSYRKEQQTYYKDRSLAGFLLCFFLGLIGLAIGFLAYDGDERESFLREWFKTFIVMIIISIVVMIVGGACIISAFSKIF